MDYRTLGDRQTIARYMSGSQRAQRRLRAAVMQRLDEFGPRAAAQAAEIVPPRLGPPNHNGLLKRTLRDRSLRPRHASGENLREPAVNE